MLWCLILGVRHRVHGSSARKLLQRAALAVSQRVCRKPAKQQPDAHECRGESQAVISAYHIA